MDIHFNRLTAKYKKETYDAKQNGIKKLVVDISDANEKSIAFHRNNGFIEYSRLENCWKKFNRNLRIVYMYKEI